MTKKNLLLGLAILTASYALSVAALEKTSSTPAAEAKSVAWYVANIQAAREKNKDCYGNPDAKELQATADCANSLQALNISHTGANQPVLKR